MCLALGRVLINGLMHNRSQLNQQLSTRVPSKALARLCEFAYIRNYTPPTPRWINGKFPPNKARKGQKKDHKNRSKSTWDDSLTEAIPAPAPDMSPSENVPADLEIPYQERSVWTGHLRGAFEQSLVVPSPQTTDLNYTFTPPRQRGPREDFTRVFLDQARLYLLAEKYGIDPLCQLVLSKFHQTLENFKLYDTGVKGISELVRFVYVNTPPTYGGKIDAMRNFVARYVVYALGQIGENEYFEELLEETGPFVRDFWHIIWDTRENLSE